MESLQNACTLKDIRSMQNRSFWAKMLVIALILASAVLGLHEGSSLAYLAGDAHRARCMGLEKSLELMKCLLSQGKHDELYLLLKDFKVGGDASTQGLFSTIDGFNSQLEACSNP